jgi:hypothetical protein
MEGIVHSLIEVLSKNLRGGTEEHEKPVRIACVPTDIRTENPQDTNLERYL